VLDGVQIFPWIVFGNICLYVVYCILCFVLMNIDKYSFVLSRNTVQNVFNILWLKSEDLLFILAVLCYVL